MTFFMSLLRRLPTPHLLAAVCVLTISLGTAFFWPAPQTPTSPLTQPLSPGTSTASTTYTDVESDTQEPADKPIVATAPEASISTAPSPTPDIPRRIENWVEYQVKSGDNLTILFKRAGLGPRDVYKISQAVSGSDTFRHLRPGQTFAFLIEDGVLRKLKHARSQLEATLIEMTDSGYQARELVRQPDARRVYAQGQIDSSLFVDAAAAGLPHRTIMQLAEIFGWDIDFALDLRAGDRFRVLYEQDYLDGAPLNRSRILAAEFINKDRIHSAIRFTDQEGSSHYFTPDGHSMRKAFLRSPVDFRRISSRFKPERYHPVLGKKRPHRGVDYAAATGTPIKAAGDGKIIWRGTKGGYGRTVILQHGGNITTLYAHMSSYRKGLSNGERVRQGQVIGYVGASGLATGPHLHYEFRINNVHKNPLTVALPAAKPVPEPERAAFKAQSEQLLAALNRETAIRLALNEQEAPQ